MKNYSEFISDLKSLVSFNSVSAQKTDGAPFGVEVKNALNHFLSRAEEMGFDTINYDNYIGEVCFGEGEEVGIIGHLDIVPVGENWTFDPFTLTEKDGFLFGRGVSDDKGPSLLCLYALKELKDSGVISKRKFRFFVGCNEEDGWADIDYLKTRTTLPTYGFSPDGNFPLSYAEKGSYAVTFAIPALKNFCDITGGTVVNAVCAFATAKVKNDGVDLNLIKKHNLLLNGEIVESRGKAAHGSTPHLGVNALKALFEYFYSVGEDVKNVLDYLFYDKAGVFDMKNEQGNVTLSPNLICQKQDKIYISCDCRIPAPFTIDDLCKKLDGFGMEYTLPEHFLPPMMVEKEGWFVSALLSSYNEVTGECAKPISMGGSTFARAFEKGCAFGIDFKRYNSNIHDADEKISLADIQDAYEIYKKALFKLATE